MAPSLAVENSEETTLEVEGNWMDEEEDGADGENARKGHEQVSRFSWSGFFPSVAVTFFKFRPVIRIRAGTSKTPTWRYRTSEPEPPRTHQKTIKLTCTSRLTVLSPRRSGLRTPTSPSTTSWPGRLRAPPDSSTNRQVTQLRPSHTKVFNFDCFV